MATELIRCETCRTVTVLRCETCRAVTVHDVYPTIPGGSIMNALDALEFLAKVGGQLSVNHWSYEGGKRRGVRLKVEVGQDRTVTVADKVDGEGSDDPSGRLLEMLQTAVTAYKAAEETSK